MAKNNASGADKDADKAVTTTATGKEKAPLETPISVQDKAEQGPAPAEEVAPSRPLKAKLPYPHNRMVIPKALTGADGSKVDLVITRQWTDVPAEVVQRVKDTARRARVRLSLAVPNNDKEG